MVNSQAKKAINKSKHSKNMPVDSSDFTIGKSVILTIGEAYWYEPSYKRLSNLLAMVEALEYLTEFIKSTPNYKKQLEDKNGKQQSKRRKSRARTS